VDAVFMDGQHLVLLDRDGAELASESSDLSAVALRDAFSRFGYPWRADGDPYRGDFRRWVEDLPGLPDGADALLRARARALRKGRNRETAALRRELLALRVIVRDDKRLQYCRTVATAPPTPEIGR
jgi:hypothetical protein